MKSHVGTLWGDLISANILCFFTYILVFTKKNTLLFYNLLSQHNDHDFLLANYMTGPSRNSNIITHHTYLDIRSRTRTQTSAIYTEDQTSTLRTFTNVCGKCLNNLTFCATCVCLDVPRVHCN